MTAFGVPLSPARARVRRWPRSRGAASTAAVAGAVLSGAMIAAEPMIALVLGGLVAALVVIVRPHLATLLVVALIYSNAPGIAVQFHGVPPVMAAAPLLLLLVPLGWLLVVRREPFVATPALVAIIAFVGIQTISTALSASPRDAFTDLMTSATEGLVLYVVVTNVVRTRRALRDVVTVLLVVGALLGALSFSQQATGNYAQEFGGFAQVSEAAFRVGPDTLAGTPTQPRLAGPVDEENRYAQILLVLIPLGLVRAWSDRGRARRVLAAAATALITLGVIVTYSRGATIALVALLALLSFTRWVTPAKATAIVVVVAVAVALVPSYRERVTTLLSIPAAFNGESDDPGIGSVRSRLTENAAAGLVFVDHPVLGVGPGRFRDNYRRYADEVGIRVQPTERTAHNLYLGIAAETGALGFTAFVAVLALTLRDLDRVRRRMRARAPALSGTATAFMLAIAMYAISGMFLHLAFVRYFWLLMALAGAVGVIAHREQRGARPEART